MLVFAAACSNKGGLEPLKGTYKIYIDNYDWGCSTSKAIISLNEPLDNVSVDDFKVVETKQAADMSKALEFPIIEVEAERKIEKAYLSDQEGNQVDEASKYITLELYVSPNDGNPLLYDFKTQLNTWSNPYYLTIEKTENAVLTSKGRAVESLQIDQAYTAKYTAADAYKTDEFKAGDGTVYAYAHFEPEKQSDTLFVWLHGLGEGGTENTDPMITALGNKTTSFIHDEFQSALGNAYVLMPQCPTYWMDADGKKTNFANGLIQAEANSYYEDSLIELINAYKAEKDIKNVVLAGCSNGGYMALLLAIHHPDSFDVVIPICEALPDALISDEQIQNIKDIPMYFIYSKDDPVVDPKLHAIPVIERLKAAKASNLHVSEFEHVVDTSGKLHDENGNPYQYVGHFSWIYFENNEADCNECKSKCWQWIGDQLKN